MPAAASKAASIANSERLLAGIVHLKGSIQAPSSANRLSSCDPQLPVEPSKCWR
jgi:hypothetical protein